jgi:SAM-dependent methyltransferase
MDTPDGTADDLARLRRERDEADTRYNEALTALDAVIHGTRRVPEGPSAYDASRLASLNERWEISSPSPPLGGWLGWLKARWWAMVAPIFGRQQAFNAELVDHLNRNVEFHRDQMRVAHETIALCRDEIDRLNTFQTRLILYAQQLTPYVDTKDRYIAGLPSGVAAAVAAFSEDLHKRWESMAAREARYDAKVGELRSGMGVLHTAVQTLKRELELHPPAGGSTPQTPSPGTTAGVAAGVSTAMGTPLDSYKYVGFEDEFRGSRQDIRDRAAAYLPFFAGASDVLDVGCGRGEFLELLRGQGVSAKGVDLNDEMAAICRSRGLEASAGDALSYLLAQPDGSLGGLFASQVVEHLEPDYLMRLLDAAFHKLRPGSRIILETINPACWYAFFSSYIRDITHVQPLHPDTLRYLLVASGFQRVDVRYSAPVSEAGDTPASGGVVETFNENVEKLNRLLFTYLDYAVVGERP